MAQQPAGDRLAQPGDQADKTDGVGNKTRGEQQGATNNQHHPLKQLFTRQLTVGHFFLDPVDGRQALALQQPDANGGGQDHQPHGRNGADKAAHLDEHNHLGNGDQDKHEQ